MRNPLAVLSLGLLLLAGCDPGYPDGSTPTLPQNTDSAAMHGVYEGTGLFTCGGAGIAGQPVDVTLRVTDIGDDYVRISLSIRPDNAFYTPRLRLEGEVRARTCLFHQYDELFKHWVNLVRTRDTITGTVGVQNVEGVHYWYLNQLEATR